MSAMPSVTHVLGKFSELLRATAEHPAMLFYLSNWQSVAEGAAPRQKRGLNENYARELMELHTLGGWLHAAGHRF